MVPAYLQFVESAHTIIGDILNQTEAFVCICLHMSARVIVILYYGNVAKVNMNTTLVKILQTIIIRYEL
jgi:hypothetical protein